MIKKNKFGVLVFSISLFMTFESFAGAFDLSAFSAQKFEVTRLDEKTLQMRGGIAEGDYQKFKQVFDSNIKIIKVSGPGGSVSEAVKMGLDIIDNDVHVIVDGPCLSSCANYHFLAGNKKTIEGDGFVAFHGSPYHGKVSTLGRSATDAFIDKGTISPLMQSHIDAERIQYPKLSNEDIVKMLNENLRPTLRDDRIFFQAVGVSPDLINNSLMGRFAETVPQCSLYYPLSEKEKAREPFFFLTINQMKEYGVTNLSGSQNWKLALQLASRTSKNKRDNGGIIFCVGATDNEDLSQVSRSLGMEIIESDDSSE